MRALDNGSVFSLVVLVPFFVIGGCVIAFLHITRKWPFHDKEPFFEPWAYENLNDPERHPRDDRGRFTYPDGPVVLGENWYDSPKWGA